MKPNLKTMDAHLYSVSVIIQGNESLAAFIPTTVSVILKCSEILPFFYHRFN